MTARVLRTVLALGVLATASAADSPCTGLKSGPCDKNSECEKTGFEGEKYCADAPMPGPRSDLEGAIHVSVDGTNSRTCGAKETPCGTLVYAVRAAQAKPVQ